jgi:hypothetical protein
MGLPSHNSWYGPSWLQLELFVKHVGVFGQPYGPVEIGTLIQPQFLDSFTREAGITLRISTEFPKLM